MKNGRPLIQTLMGISCLALIAGCIPSLHPLYSGDEDLVFDSALIGRWAEEGDEDTWEFTKSGEKEYKLVVTEHGKTGTFSVHLVKVQGRLFLDFYPEGPEMNAAGFYKLHLQPVHTFMRVDQIEPTLKMAVMDPEWIEKLLKEDPSALRHEITDARLVITATPKEIQAFLIKHLDTEKAFGDLSDLKRIDAAQTE